MITLTFKEFSTLGGKYLQSHQKWSPMVAAPSTTWPGTQKSGAANSHQHPPQHAILVTPDLEEERNMSLAYLSFICKAGISRSLKCPGSLRMCNVTLVLLFCIAENVSLSPHCFQKWEEYPSLRRPGCFTSFVLVIFLYTFDCIHLPYLTGSSLISSLWPKLPFQLQNLWYCRTNCQ